MHYVLTCGECGDCYPTLLEARVHEEFDCIANAEYTIELTGD